MPSYNPALYPSHPIQIPDELPKILKNYTKAAIRTQPTDLLLWSASYFRCLSNGEVPPVKERLEYPLPETWHGLTPGLVRVLHKQLGNRGQTTVKLQTLQKKWRGLSLEAEELEKMIKEGKFLGQNEIDWKKCLALICLGVGRNDVEMAMKIVSEACSDTSKGEGCSMNAQEFIEMFKLVSEKKGMEAEKIREIADYLDTAGSRQDGILSHENFKTDLCPPLN
eukprot:12990.XXX_424267_423316_1 [CDS] Oithona nana genome sequencing.